MFLWWWLKRWSSKTPRARKRAIERLGAYADPRAAVVIAQALEDPDLAVRHAAAETLCRYNFQQASRVPGLMRNDIIPPLGRAIRDREICRLALQVLPRIAQVLKDEQDSPFGESVIHALYSARFDKNTEIRRAAVRADGHCAWKWGQPPFPDHLRPLIRDRDIQVRQEVATALGEFILRHANIVGTEFCEMLALLLNDRETEVRRTAVKVLGKVALFLAAANPNFWSDRIVFIGLLVQATSDPDMEVQQSAAKSLRGLSVTEQERLSSRAGTAATLKHARKSTVDKPDNEREPAIEDRLALVLNRLKKIAANCAQVFDLPQDRGIKVTFLNGSEITHSGLIHDLNKFRSGLEGQIEARQTGQFHGNAVTQEQLDQGIETMLRDIVKTLKAWTAYGIGGKGMEQLARIQKELKAIASNARAE